MKIKMLVLPFLIIGFAYFVGNGFSLVKPDNGEEDTINTPDIVSVTGIDLEKLLPNQEITLFNHKTNEVIAMDFEEYVIGVVAAEMPASFELEALKAQAVASRSYFLSRVQHYRNHGTPPEHNGADICSYFGHCTAWTPLENKRDSWGADFDVYANKITEAVNSTHNQYMMYDQSIVKAFFYAMSSGNTESAADVWGGEDLPYLRSVDSGVDKNIENYETSVEFSAEEFRKRLSENNAEFTRPISESIGGITRTDGGAIKTISIGGKTFKGTEIRRIFNLRSANFEIYTDDSIVQFSVKGHGHGVGMSQHGANAHAKEGMSYEDILKIYYSGVDIVK